MANKSKGNWLCVADAAPMFGRSNFQVRKWCRLGKIACRKINDRWYIHRDTVNRMLSEKEGKKGQRFQRKSFGEILKAFEGGESGSKSE